MDIIKNNNIINTTINKIKENKYVLMGLIFVLSIYSSKWVYNLSDNFVDIFDSPIVKFIIFILISYISIDNPSIGIIITIAVLVTLQVISNIKIRKEINSDLKLEDFDSNISSTNLNIESPEQLYNKIISSNNKLKQYVKFDNIKDNYLNNPEIMESFGKMKDNYVKLENPNLKLEQFNKQLIKYYESKLDLLEIIFKYKKESMNKDKSKYISDLLDKTKQDKKEKKKDWFEKLEVLTELLF